MFERLIIYFIGGWYLKIFYLHSLDGRIARILLLKAAEYE